MAYVESGPLVLLIEDNSEVAHLYRAILSLADTAYRVAWEESGKGGIEAARTLQPDVIVLDLSLGDVDGRSVMRSLHDMPETSSIPVVVASAYTGRLRRSDLDLAHTVLEKPFGIERLHAAIASALEDSRNREPDRAKNRKRS